MTAGTKKPPSSHLRWQGTRAVVVYGLMLAWVAGAAWLVQSGLSQSPIAREQSNEAVLLGDGDMSTDRFRLTRGLHRVTWDAPCQLDVELWRYRSGRDEFVMPLGRSSFGARTLPISNTGRYFLSIGADCAWKVQVR